jgi:hypothetical protein
MKATQRKKGQNMTDDRHNTKPRNAGSQGGTHRFIGPKKHRVSSGRLPDSTDPKNIFVSPSTTKVPNLTSSHTASAALDLPPATKIAASKGLFLSSIFAPSKSNE